LLQLIVESEFLLLQIEKFQFEFVLLKDCFVVLLDNCLKFFIADMLLFSKAAL